MSRTASTIPGWYVELQANVLRQLPRPEEIDQTTGEGWNNNQKALKKALGAALLPPKEDGSVENQTDPRFAALNSFDIVVPEDYDHTTRLDSFKEKHEREFNYHNQDISDKNFSKATTHQLVPGRKLTVKVFQIIQRVSSGDCMAFLRSQNAVLVGAQGASLAYEQAKDQLPINRWGVSFDEKSALWKDSDGAHRVPCVARYSDDHFGFFLGYFEHDWNGDHCLLVFCDSTESSDT